MRNAGSAHSINTVTPIFLYDWINKLIKCSKKGPTAVKNSILKNQMISFAPFYNPFVKHWQVVDILNA